MNGFWKGGRCPPPRSVKKKCMAPTPVFFWRIIRRQWINMHERQDEDILFPKQVYYLPQAIVCLGISTNVASKDATGLPNFWLRDAVDLSADFIVVNLQEIDMSRNNQSADFHSDHHVLMFLKPTFSTFNDKDFCWKGFDIFNVLFFCF